MARSLCWRQSLRRRPITLLYAGWIPQDRFFVLAFLSLVSRVGSDVCLQQNRLKGGLKDCLELLCPQHKLRGMKLTAPDYEA
jgi:hypothetical protein